ncbi:MAG: T9SS type A sorting domain-containing protein [Bacteroidota bacterium]
MKIIFRNLVGLGLLASLLTTPMIGREKPEGPKGTGSQSLDKAAQTKNAAILNINNFTSWSTANGQGQQPPNQAYNGDAFPRGTTHPIFADGMLWGAKCYLDAAHTQVAPVQLIRVGGNTYNVGNAVGWINGSGASAVPVSTSDAKARIYRIRRDWTIMAAEELKRDAAENNLTTVSAVTDADVVAIQAQYATDWLQWPAGPTNDATIPNLGAPYIERNGVAGYQRPPAFGPAFTLDSLIAGNYDEPGVAGSDPTSPAGQVMWTVFNDLTRGNMISFEGSEPMGLEGQLTIWGYKRGDALGNLYFKRLKLINKGGAVVNSSTGAKGSLYLDSVYVCQWSDEDLGNAGDDLSGCDSLLSLAFVYNGNGTDNEYSKFNLPPPAVGYDFLAGPIQPSVGDTAVFDLKPKPGYKNLGMSSFCWFAAGNSLASDPPFSYEGALQWWKLLRGFRPTASTTQDQLYPGPAGDPPSHFPFGGDPYRQTGFLDGAGTAISSQPGDRRTVSNTGPFTLAPGDTQEVTIGVVAGLGGDRLSSVAVMKANDAAVQQTYDLRFQVSQPPAAPLVTATELDGKVILEWGSNAARVKDTETKISQPGTFTFEGYNVYQLPSASAGLSDGKRLATYDVVNAVGVILNTEFDLIAGQNLSKPIQFGSNSGIQRYFVFDRDYLRDINALNNGQDYYVAVTAYSRSVDPGFVAALESSPIVQTIRPKHPYGVAPVTSFGDTVAVTKAGPSDGRAIVLVVSPTQVTGHIYKVTFDATGGTWNLTDVSGGPIPGTSTTRAANTVVASGISDQDGDAASPIVDGLQVKVFGAPNGTKDFLHVAGPSGALNPFTYASFSTFNSWGFPCASGVDQAAASGGGPSIGDWGGGRWGVHTGGSGGGDESYETRFIPRVFRNDNYSRYIPYDYELRFTAAGGKAYLAFTTGAVINVPFEIWNIGIGTPTDASDDIRMIPWVNDGDGDGTFNLEKIDHGVSGGDNDPYTDWIYWMDANPKTPGSAGYNAFVADANYDAGGAVTGTGGEVMARVVLVNVNGGSVSAANWPTGVALMPATGNIIRIISTKPNSTVDQYTFNTATYMATRSVDLEKESVNKVGVFPNPYYAFNPQETNRFVRFVTFNNLPPTVKVRIFNLAGQLVRTLDKSDPSGFLRWDLNNQYRFPVASGIYLAYLEMTLTDGTVMSKVLKLAIIQEQEVPDVF